MTKEPTKEMLEYALRHSLVYNPVGGAWCFECISHNGAFGISYSEVKELASAESLETELDDEG